MPASVPYEYAIIRLVPRVEREEFINIGVILFSRRKKYLGIKYLIDEQKISAFSPDTDIELIRAHIEAWETVCKGGREGGRIGQLEQAVRFRWLAAPRSTIIQSSSIHPGTCEEPATVLAELFARYVLPST